MTELIGRWAVCGAGRIGRIAQQKGDTYYGVALDGTNWRTICPHVLSDAMQAYLNAHVS